MRVKELLKKMDGKKFDDKVKDIEEAFVFQTTQLVKARAGKDGTVTFSTFIAIKKEMEQWLITVRAKTNGLPVRSNLIADTMDKYGPLLRKTAPVGSREE